MRLVQLTRYNYPTGKVDKIGPFEFVQITYQVVRVSEGNPDIKYYDSESGNTIAKWAAKKKFWVFADGSEWSDLVVTGDNDVNS